MTSPTDKTENRRRAKKVKNGFKQKNKIRAKGTTPQLFALNKPTTTAEQNK